MDQEHILERLGELAADHFDRPGLELTGETVAGDVPGWDSLAHIQFMLEVERCFSVRFKSAEIGNFQDVGHLVNRIHSLMSA